MSVVKEKGGRGMNYLFPSVFTNYLENIRRSQIGGILLNAETVLLMSWLCFAHQHQILCEKLFCLEKHQKLSSKNNAS